MRVTMSNERLARLMALARVAERLARMMEQELTRERHGGIDYNGATGESPSAALPHQDQSRKLTESQP